MDLSAVVKDAGVLAGIIGLTGCIKSMDTKQRFKRFYVLIPAILGIVAALALAQPFTWQEILKQALIYAGVASWVYKTGKTAVLGK